MVNLRNKPITFLIATLLLGIGMLIGAGYVIFILIGSLFVLEDAGLGAVIYGSAITLYVVQIIFYIALGWLLLRRIYRWSIPAIIVSTIICPLTLLIVLASISTQFGYTVDLSNPVGLGLLIFLALTPLAMGVVAYNDIRYRLPKIKRGVRSMKPISRQ